jgi:hypothetical protein
MVYNIYNQEKIQEEAVNLTNDERDLYNECKCHSYNTSTTVYIPIDTSHDFRIEVDELLRSKNMFPYWINVNPYADNIPSIVYLYEKNYNNVLAVTSRQQREDVNAAINA